MRKFGFNPPGIGKGGAKIRGKQEFYEQRWTFAGLILARGPLKSDRVPGRLLPVLSLSGEKIKAGAVIGRDMDSIVSGIVYNHPDRW